MQTTINKQHSDINRWWQSIDDTFKNSITNPLYNYFPNAIGLCQLSKLSLADYVWDKLNILLKGSIKELYVAINDPTLSATAKGKADIAIIIDTISKEFADVAISQLHNKEIDDMTDDEGNIYPEYYDDYIKVQKQIEQQLQLFDKANLN